jgi:preprotein translocase subunit SecE
MSDKLKLVAAFLLVAAGVAGFYALQESASVLRALSVLAGVAAGVAVALTSAMGKSFAVFGRESVAEAKRVVWPTRKETLQTTGIVVLFAVTMALFLWAVDATLLMIVNKLMGRGE